MPKGLIHQSGILTFLPFLYFHHAIIGKNISPKSLIRPMSERLAAYYEIRTYYFTMESQKPGEIKINM
jgi:hypothetical protein